MQFSPGKGKLDALSGGSLIKNQIVKITPTYGKLSGSIEARYLTLSGSDDANVARTPITVLNTFTYYVSSTKREKRVQSIDLTDKDLVTITLQNSNAVTLNVEKDPISQKNNGYLSVKAAKSAAPGKTYSNKVTVSIKNIGKDVKLNAKVITR